MGGHLERDLPFPLSDRHSLLGQIRPKPLVRVVCRVSSSVLLAWMGQTTEESVRRLRQAICRLRLSQFLVMVYNVISQFLNLSIAWQAATTRHKPWARDMMVIHGP